MQQGKSLAHPDRSLSIFNWVEFDLIVFAPPKLLIISPVHDTVLEV
jgi:hypothetical protein